MLLFLSKQDQKVFLFNYSLKNHSGFFLVKKMVKKGYYKNERLSLAWDLVKKVYKNHIKVHEIIEKYLRLYKSVQDCSNSNLHSWNTLSG